MTIRVHIEFLGLSRFAVGAKEIAFELDEGTSFRDIVRMLSSRYPKLIGNVIQPDGETLHPPNILNLNAQQMIQPHQMDEGANDGDRIILMSVSAGG